MESRLLAAPGAELKARLAEKLQYLPSARIRGMMPAGAQQLSEVPARTAYASKEEWLAAIRRTVQCFALAQKSNESLAEEESYVVWVNTWLELSGHGTYVSVDHSVSGLAMQLHVAEPGRALPAMPGAAACLSAAAACV